MIRPEFDVHALNDGGMEKARKIATGFCELLAMLEAECAGVNDAGGRLPGDGRLMSLVRTKLEEACFFAKKAMASQRSNQRQA